LIGLVRLGSVSEVQERRAECRLNAWDVDDNIGKFHEAFRSNDRIGVDNTSY